MSNNRWRKILRVSRPVIEQEVGKLDAIELWHAVGIGSCSYNEDECFRTLNDQFEIILRNVPKHVLLAPGFTNWQVNEYISDLQENTNRSFEEEIK